MTPGASSAGKFEQAVAFHREGRLAQAEALYRDIVSETPEHCEALHLLGVLALQREDWAAALELIGRAIALNSGSAAMHLDMGVALRGLRRSGEALASYERALTLRPDYAKAACNRGGVLRDLGRPREALASYERALAHKPDYADAFAGRANALCDLGRTEEALVSYERALALDPGNVQALNNRGVALRSLKQPREALESLERALALRPDFAQAQINRANVLLELNRPSEALAAHDRALSLAPGDIETLNNRGHLLLGAGRPAEALADFDRALALRPAFAAAWTNRGNALRALGRLEEAFACHERAVALAPRDAQAWSNRGLVLCELGRPHEALECYERALAASPEHADAHWNRAICRLLLGDFERGWQGFEWRWRSQFAQFKRDLPGPLWLGGESLAGKTILVHAEQGQGDTIQFCRYGKLLSGLGANVLLEVQPPLMGLLRNLPGVSRVLARGEPLPAYDFQCPLLSLPLALGTRLDTIPSELPYLAAPVELVARWKERLAALAGLRIGIAWQGNPSQSRDRFRSLPLEHFAQLAAVPGVNLVSLQKGQGAEQLGEIRGRFTVADFTEELDQANGPFMDTAAIMKNLDLVITSDTAIPHLAGALGVAVWVALPFAPDWRWLLGRNDCPWYPSMRLFRQKVPDDWRGVFDAIRMALDERRRQHAASI